MLQKLAEIPDVESHLVTSRAGMLTIAAETDHTTSEVAAMADVAHSPSDVGATIASGSFRTHGMVVAPCSMRTLGAIANSMADNLLTRAADVTLKEGRPLVLMVRESPLHPDHLRLMSLAAEAGAVIAPPVPAFYHRPTTLDEIIDHSVARALDRLGITGTGTREWEGLRDRGPEP